MKSNISRTKKINFVIKIYTKDWEMVWYY